MELLFILLLVSSAATNYIDHFDHHDEPHKIAITDKHTPIGNRRMKRLIQDTRFEEDEIPCVRPDGKNGHCRHISYCMQKEFETDYIKLASHMCILPENAIRVCCPIEREGVAALAGKLPAIASLVDEDNELSVTFARAENRGCGVSTRAQTSGGDSREVGTRDWPWMVLLITPNTNAYCGGSLITRRHVLTAAHCTFKWKVDQLKVRLGEYDYDRENDTRSYEVNIVKKIEHANYDKMNHNHDICLLKLDRAALFNTYVWPICLPPAELDITQKLCTLIGWGTTFLGGPVSNVLMEVSVPIWDHGECVNAHSNTIFDENICAGEPGKDACQNDSGGPLMYQLPSGRWIVVGIVSWGVKCADKLHPGVYVGVHKYLGWIKANVRLQ